MTHRSDDSGVMRILASLRRYCVGFLFIAFVITCCMTLFLRSMMAAAGISTLPEEIIQVAAKLTFAKVALLSLLFTAIDGIRRKVRVNRPVRQITQAAEKIVQGDFSVRIPPVRGIAAEDGFNQIIDCFNQMTEELSGMETLRTDFIANVSHELKTPLAVMQNYGTLLQQPGLPEEKRIEYAKSVTDACRRLASLITNILKLNKLENQQIFPSVTEYDLSEQLCESLLQFESVWEKKGIEVDADIAENIRVQADSELLSLVWNNLLSNAFKFTENGGTVSVMLSADDYCATVKISDTGCGMTPEVGAHIFEKFYQGDTSHSTQGNGLGLALVKRVVDILRGEIRVESILGEGSTFTVKIGRS